MTQAAASASASSSTAGAWFVSFGTSGRLEKENKKGPKVKEKRSL